MPDKTYDACANHTKLLIQDNPDHLHHYELFENYYKQIMALFVNTDKYMINEARKNFNFEMVNDSYRLIDHTSESVFIKDYNTDSLSLYEKIKSKEFLSSRDYRDIQPYCVSLYSSSLIKLSSFYTIIKPGIKVWLGEYNKNTGLIPDISNDPIWIV